MTDLAARDQLAAQVARRLVSTVAAHEMGIFRAASRAYFKNPNRALRRHSVEEILAFGAGSVEVLTPYALAIADAVVTQLGAELGSDLAGLTGEQLDRARQLAVAKGRELQLDEEKVSLLAEALVGVLAGPPG